MKKLKLVKLTDASQKEDYIKDVFDPDHTFVFLGEIKGMPGHCVVIGTTTEKVYTGYHTDNFIELTEDEI